MIFIDTDIISYFFNGNVNIKEKILELIKKDESICMTTINIYEIQKGLRWKNNKSKEVQFNSFLDDVRVFSLDDVSIGIAANIYADLRKTGNTIGDADILIAAIVIRNNGTLVSNNIKHYENMKKLRLARWI
jgi:tRNA(fMet)-specific endonuclease VapC